MLFTKLIIHLRFFVRFSYLGKSYHGWQRQPNALTVQEKMESCFTALLRQPVVLVGAGRTDTGVHAREMFAHFDLESRQDTTDWVTRLNSFLPADIALKEIFPVYQDVHARFSAVERSYEYVIVQQKDPFYLDTAYYSRQAYDIKKMNAAAESLLGQQDFKAFSKTKTDVKTFVCDIREAAWHQDGQLLIFKITADRFLRNMVRAIVGTLLEVGLGKLSLKDVKTIIKSGDRSLAGASVPAKGLSLIRVLYPEDILLVNG